MHTLKKGSNNRPSTYISVKYQYKLVKLALKVNQSISPCFGSVSWVLPSLMNRNSNNYTTNSYIALMLTVQDIKGVTGPCHSDCN